METSTSYTVSYFINKFEAIPEEKWCVGAYKRNGKHCAFGHCNILDEAHGRTDEATCLDNIFKRGLRPNTFSVVAVNDGADRDYQQPTPKQRIIAVLQDIKKQQAVTYADAVINNIEETKIKQLTV